MGLKVAINGEKKVIASRKTRPVVFLNGAKKRLTKGLTFVNGQKKYLWGTESRVEFFSFAWDLGQADNVIVDIDETRMTLFGKVFIKVWMSGSSGGGGRLPVTPSPSHGGWAYISQSNQLTTLDISNVSAGTQLQSYRWGNSLNLVNPNESDDSQTVWYTTSSGTRNRIKYLRGDVPVVDGTYSGTGQSSLLWCVPLPNGKNLWGNGSTLGYDSTTVSTAATTGNAVWDGTNTVFTGGSAIYRCTISGCTQIVASIPTAYMNKMADGDTLLVAGYNNGTTTAKLIKYDADGQLLWEKTMDGDSSSNQRRAKIICRSGGVYYVLDEPMSTSSSDQTVYLRMYTRDGEVFGTEVLPYTTVEGTRIIDWKVKPHTVESNYTGLYFYNGGNAYVVRIFVG